MVQILGEKQLLRNLAKAAQHPTVQEMDRIAIDALEPMRAETAMLAPRAALKRGVVTRKRRARGRAMREYWIALKRGLPMRIAHLVEFGTAPHSLAKGASRRRGIMQNVPPFHPGDRAEPFMTPAFESEKDTVITGYGRMAFDAIVRAVGVRSGR